MLLLSPLLAFFTGPTKDGDAPLPDKMTYAANAPKCSDARVQGATDNGDTRNCGSLIDLGSLQNSLTIKHCTLLHKSAPNICEGLRSN